MEKALDNYKDSPDVFDPSILGRVGCWVSSEVKNKTTIAILRIRHQLTTQSRHKTNTLLVEEASCISWAGRDTNNLIDGKEVLKLISAMPSKTLPSNLVNRNIKEALSKLSELKPAFNEFAENRSRELINDHRRVREASDARGKYNVKALLPIDVVGLYVLLPSVE